MKRYLTPLILFSCSLFAKADSNHEKMQGLVYQGDNWWRWSNERQAELCYTKAINETDSSQIIEMATLRRGLLYVEMGENELAIEDFARSFQQPRYEILTSLINDPIMHDAAHESIADGMRQILPKMKPAIFDAAVRFRTRGSAHPSRGEVGGVWDFLYDGDSLARFHEIPERISKCIEEIESECMIFFEKARDALIEGKMAEATEMIQEAIRKKFISTEHLVHQKTTTPPKKEPKPKPIKPKPAPRPAPKTEAKPKPKPLPPIVQPDPRPVPKPILIAPEEPVKKENPAPRRGRRGRGRNRATVQPKKPPMKARPTRREAAAAKRERAQQAQVARREAAAIKRERVQAARSARREAAAAKKAEAKPARPTRRGRPQRAQAQPVSRNSKPVQARNKAATQRNEATQKRARAAARRGRGRR